MFSKNKPKQTPDERLHAARVAAMDCIICGAIGPSEVHEPEQGMWWIAIPLCRECHTGSKGWHGNRQRWTFRKQSELRAINETLEKLLT